VSEGLGAGADGHGEGAPLVVGGLVGGEVAGPDAGAMADW